MDISDALRRMDLNLVLPLDALLEERHVTRAAESIGIGQPAMSAALARLRRLFGDPLLVRNGRVHELTPMGQSLVEPVRAVLTGLEQLLATTPHFDPGTDERTFTVVASDYVTLTPGQTWSCSCTFPGHYIVPCDCILCKPGNYRLKWTYKLLEEEKNQFAAGSWLGELVSNELVLKVK